MYYLITCMTRNRGFSKAKHAAYSKLAELQSALASCSDELSFSGVIIVLVDQPTDYFILIPNNDNVYQVNVGYEHQRIFRRTDSAAAFWQCLEAVRISVASVPASADQRARLLECYRQFADGLQE